MSTNASLSPIDNPFENESRVVPLPVAEMRDDWLRTLARIPGDGLKGEGFPRNVLGTIMYNPETFGPFLEYWVTSKSELSLSVREQELVILRMACLYRSNYVWKHHVKVGREFGISDVELDALRSASFDGSFVPREASLLEVCDELVERRTLSRESWARHGDVLDTRAFVDLVALVSQYVFFALMNNVMQVQVEEALEDVPDLGTSLTGGETSSRKA